MLPPRLPHWEEDDDKERDAIAVRTVPRITGRIGAKL
jgi:hypothetical protein